MVYANPNLHAPDTSAAAAAVGRIIDRRTDAQACDLGKLSDDPDDMLAYLTAHRELPERRQVPRDVQVADVGDAWIIARFVAARDYRASMARLRDVLLMGRGLKMRHLDLARMMGARRRQAGQQAIDRFTAAAGGAGRNLTVEGRRRRRRAVVAAHEASQRVSLAGELRGLVEALVGARRHVPIDLGDDVDDLATGLERWRAGAPCPSELLDDVRMLLIDLRSRPGLDTGLRALVVQGAQVVDRARAT